MQLGTVVLLAVISGYDRKRLRALRDRQRALRLRDRVVSGLAFRGSACQRVSERIGLASDVRDRSRHIRGIAFALNESVSAYSYGVIRQRRSVILLAVGRGGQGHCSLRDRQRSVCRCHRLILIGVLKYKCECVVVGCVVTYILNV